MKTKQFFQTLAASVMLAATMGLGFTACSTIDNPINLDPTNPDTPVTESKYDGLKYFLDCFVSVDDEGNFQRHIFGVPLDPADTTVVSIGVRDLDEAREIFTKFTSPTASAELTETASSGLEYKPTSSDGKPQGTVWFTPVDEDIVIAKITFSEDCNLKYISQINFIRHHNWISSTNEDTEHGNEDYDFIHNWDKKYQTLVLPSDNSQTTARNYPYLPWADAYDGKIPDEVRFDYEREKGWEVTFSTLSDPGLSSRYFALYNRFTGKMRIFVYVDDATGTGSDFAFRVLLGNGDQDLQYPFYHALSYAIPVNHNVENRTINPAIDLIGASKANEQSDTKSQGIWDSYYTPQVNDVSHCPLYKGWSCFDIDLSGYQQVYAKGGSWLDDPKWSHKTMLTIETRTREESEVSLSGTIEGNIGGVFSPAGTSSCKGLSISAGALSTLGGLWNNPVTQELLGKKPGGQPATGVAKALGSWTNAIGGIMSVAGMALDIANKATAEPTSGSIDMTTTGNVDISGYISTVTSNNVAPLSLSANYIKRTNPDSHIGQGIWSLDDDPVIYVVKDAAFVDAALAKKRNEEYGYTYLYQYDSNWAPGRWYDAFYTGDYNYIYDTYEHSVDPKYVPDPHYCAGIEVNYYDHTNIKSHNDSYFHRNYKYNDDEECDVSNYMMVQFLDPNSIKLNINQELYPDISDVTLSATYGIYPDEAMGHTKPYQDMLVMGDLPTWQWTEKQEFYTIWNPKTTLNYVAELDGHYYYAPREGGKRVGWDNEMSLIEVTEVDPKATINDGGLNSQYEIDASRELSKQGGTVSDVEGEYYTIDGDELTNGGSNSGYIPHYRFFGHCYTNDLGKKFVNQPVVYYPYANNGNSYILGDAQVPDFVVVVTLTFMSQGNLHIFTQKYIPKIVSISRSELAAKTSDIFNFYKKVEEGSTFSRNGLIYTCGDMITTGDKDKGFINAIMKGLGLK